GFNNDRVHLFKSEPAPKLAEVAMIALKDTFTKVLRYTQGDIMGDVRIAVAITSGPEANPDQIEILPFRQRDIQALGHFLDHDRNYLVEYVLKKPAQAYRFIKGRRFFAVEEGCLTELFQKEVDMFEPVGADRLIEVVDNRQHTSGIELCGMRGQHNTHAEVFQLAAQLIHEVFRLRTNKDGRQRAASLHIVQLSKGSILYRVEQYNLAFRVLNEIEEQVELLFACGFGDQLAKEL